MKPNTKITLNNKESFFYEPKGKSIGKDLFNQLLDSSQEFVMNDDGSKFERKLSKFDISKDKIIGGFWNFKVNLESKKILPKVFDYYLNNEWGFWTWSLKGKDFTIEYHECGDEEYYQENMLAGPNGEKTIYNDFNIKSKGKSLNIVKSILNSYSAN